MGKKHTFIFTERVCFGALFGKIDKKIRHFAREKKPFKH